MKASLEPRGEWDGLDVDPVLGVFLSIRRYEVDGPLGPMLLEWDVDVLDA